MLNKLNRKKLISAAILLMIIVIVLVVLNLNVKNTKPVIAELLTDNVNAVSEFSKEVETERTTSTGTEAAVTELTPTLTIAATPVVENKQELLNNNINKILTASKYSVTLQSKSDQCTTVVQTVNGKDFENTIAGYHLATDKITDCSRVLFRERFINGAYGYNNGMGWSTGIYEDNGVLSSTAKKIDLSKYINPNIAFVHLTKTDYGYSYTSELGTTSLDRKTITTKFNNNLIVTEVDTVTPFGTDILSLSLAN